MYMYMWYIKGDRISVDSVKNNQGELLIGCMQSSGMCLVNGLKGVDEVHMHFIILIFYIFIPN